MAHNLSKSPFFFLYAVSCDMLFCRLVIFHVLKLFYYLLLLTLRRLFQVHERGGPRDKIIYNTTLLLGAVVGFGILELMYRGMFPRGLKRGLLGIED